MIHGPFQQRLVRLTEKTQGHSAGDGCIVVPLHTRDIPLADDVNYLVRLRTIPYQVAHAHNGIRAEGIGLFEHGLECHQIAVYIGNKRNFHSLKYRHNCAEDARGIQRVLRQ